METMCNSSMGSGVKENARCNEASDENTYQSSPKNFSPVFGGVSSIRNVRYIQSPDSDIPSYQFPREYKRCSDISEEQDSILPISPACTPPSIKKIEDLEEPLIHTIGTIVKKNAGSKVMSNDASYAQVESETKQYSGVFGELGILEKDISWDSSMETPAPHPLSLDDYNTIERATLLPESDMKSIQPRALFSPYKNDDLDCIPLKYSSESDDDGVGDDYDKKIQLSDKCQILEGDTRINELKDDNTFIGSQKHSLSNSHIGSLITFTTKDLDNEKEIALSPGSPVFRVKKNNKKPKTKKLRGLLVKSPAILESTPVDDKEGNEINCPLGFSGGFTEKGNSTGQNSFYSEQSNSIQDDSFQNMSFSGIDELCQSSVAASGCDTTNNTDVSSVSKDNADGKESCKTTNLSLIFKGKIHQGKFFYDNTEKSEELHLVSSVDSFLKSAMRLEEGSDVFDNKVKNVLLNNELTVFSKMVQEVPVCDVSGQGMKRVQSEYLLENTSTNLRENKMIKLNNCKDNEIPKNEEAEELISVGDVTLELNSHFDANDSQMCLTADYAESLIKCADQGGNNFIDSVNDSIKTNQIESNTDFVDEMSCDQNSTTDNVKFPMFSTALGNSISVSNEAYKKVQSIFKEDEDNSAAIKSEFLHNSAFEGEEEIKEAAGNNHQGFQKESGAAVKINEKSSSKVKNLFRDLMAEEKCMEIPFMENIGFATASGSKIKISEESLSNARKLLESIDVKTENFEDFKEIKGNVDRKPTISDPVRFMTASNKQIKISEESLRKVKGLWKGEEELRQRFLIESEEKKVTVYDIPSRYGIGNEICTDGVGIVPKCCGFSTASGRNVTVSDKALSKARRLLGEDEESIIDDVSTAATGEASIKESKNILPDNGSENNNEDSEELIPAWLHVYNTSPTLTMERLHLEAVTSHEDCQRSSSREQYTIRNPTLGSTDRFHNKRKRNIGRKLIFEPSAQLEIPQNNDRKSNFIASCKFGTRKRDELDRNIDFGVPFKRRKLNDIESGDSSSGNAAEAIAQEEKLSEEVKEGRRKARLEQIKAANKERVKPVKGSHLLKKIEPQSSWCEAVQGNFPERYPRETLIKHGVREDVIAITASTAADYKFKSTDFYTSAVSLTNVNGFPCGDGCSLIYDDENKAGVEEFTAAFLASPGVESSLIPKEWVKNHYKWIVWKFSHYERSFPFLFGGRCLTPHNVLVQLKYRYDREIDCSQRSALKKILEGDDSSAKRIVLCVFAIKKTSDSDRKYSDTSLESLMTYKLGLTDGWYGCYVQTDSAMTRLVEEGKVFIGVKLVTQGAELLNCEKCASPLEAGENLHLKISTNSTRRAKWDVKLGFQKNGGPILVNLNSILLNGGIVGRIDVVIARIYPLLYMEKKPDGTHVTRNSRTEDRVAAAYQQQQEAAMEKIYQQVRDELRNKEKEKEKLGIKLVISAVKEITDAEELYKLYESCSDPSLLQTLLTSQQKETLIDYQRRKTEITNKELSDKVQERIKAEKVNNRKVSQLLRIKIVDLHKPDYTSPVLFTVWNSIEDVSRLFAEGKAISIFNTTPGNSRFFNSVQLNSTRKTRYKEISQHVDYPARKLTNLNELTVDYEAVFNEVDIVGIVVATHESSHGSRLSQTIFLADEGFNYAGIVFWGHCKDYGWENTLSVSSIVACSNLQWNKKRSSSSIPSVFVNDTSVFTENPKQMFLKEGIERLRIALPEDKKSFISKCAVEITSRLGDYKNNWNSSKNPPLPTDYNINSNLNPKPKYINGFKTKPNASSTPFKSCSFGLDTNDQEPSPIQKRIEKLQMYGEPPPLSPLLPLDNLEKFKSKFRVPFKNSSTVNPK